MLDLLTGGIGLKIAGAFAVIAATVGAWFMAKKSGKDELKAEQAVSSLQQLEAQNVATKKADAEVAGLSDADLDQRLRDKYTRPGA